MSARNYYSARDKNYTKLIDSLPQINHQKFFYRSGEGLPPLSANTNNFINRNINYSFEVQSYGLDLDNHGRAGSPLSDFFSESETGTPDLQSDESDSSAGSVLRKNTAEASKTLADEWERIERTIFEEEGEKINRPNMLEECRQWMQLHPQLRVVGKAIPLPDKRLNYRQIEHEEIIAQHYSDYEDFSESAERLSQSSTDTTPQNSPRVSLSEETTEPKLFREKVSFLQTFDEDDFNDDFCSLLQISPMQIRSPCRKRQNSSIIKSEIASSRWMRNNRPDSSINCDRNSAKSFISLDTKNYNNMVLSASDRDKVMNRVTTARHRDLTKLEPLYTLEYHQNDLSRVPNGSVHHLNMRKVSLPPLQLEDERKKIGTVNSAKKNKVSTAKSRKGAQKSLFHLDRVKHI